MTMKYRSGFGYDVHQLVEGRKLFLGGVQIPFEKGLMGHSDADVLLHAVCDALLGASALGDIGAHFPDDSDLYLNISSIKLLSTVYDILQGNGFRPVNVDAMLVLEAPRVADYVYPMRRNIAQALRLEVGDVSVKATTNERLGFVGRQEGIAAMATVMVVQV